MISATGVSLAAAAAASQSSGRAATRRAWPRPTFARSPKSERRAVDARAHNRAKVAQAARLAERNLSALAPPTRIPPASPPLPVRAQRASQQPARVSLANNVSNGARKAAEVAPRGASRLASACGRLVSGCVCVASAAQGAREAPHKRLGRTEGDCAAARCNNSRVATGQVTSLSSRAKPVEWLLASRAVASCAHLRTRTMRTCSGRPNSLATRNLQLATRALCSD